VLVRIRSTQGKRPSKGDDAKGKRDSRNNGEWAFCTACTVQAGSRVMTRHLPSAGSRTTLRLLGLRWQRGSCERVRQVAVHMAKLIKWRPVSDCGQTSNDLTYYCHIVTKIKTQW
jgi:hypothetical protein